MMKRMMIIIAITSFSCIFAAISVLLPFAFSYLYGDLEKVGSCGGGVDVVDVRW